MPTAEKIALMSKRRPHWYPFVCHQENARRRGILFEFTYEVWVAWWEDKLGPDWRSLRGKGKHRYVMARRGDTGPYAINNVECVTGGKNRSDQVPLTKLTEADVFSILRDSRTQQTIADDYGVSQHAISSIKLGKSWRHLHAQV